ncbi:uncharacterized protein V6R79_015894 [Siganus canaliculatus]
MENNGSLWKLEEKTQGLEESHVGAVVLASVYLVLGVVAFFCVFYVQRKKLGGLSCSTHDRPKSLRNVHSFLIALLTVDFLHVIVTISVLILFMTDTRDFVRSIGLNVWLASMHFMVFLHLITALTSICYLCTPPSKGRLPPWCMAPVMVLCLLALSALYSDYILYVETALGFFVIALVLSIIFRNCCSRESHLVTVWRIPIVLVAVISVCVCFFPSIIFHYLFLLSSKGITKDTLAARRLPPDSDTSAPKPGILVGYFLLGVFTFILAFWFQPKKFGVFKQSFILFFTGQQGKLRGVQNVHPAIFVMLTVQLVNAIAGLTLAIGLSSGSCFPQVTMWCINSSLMWMMTRMLAIVVHLLTALVSVFYLCHPQSGAKLRCVVTVGVWSVLVFIPIYYFLSMIGLYELGAIAIALALTIVGKCVFSRRFHARGKPIVIISMITFFVVFAPAYVMECVIIAGRTEWRHTIYVNFLFCTSFQLFLDGLLCFFILRLPGEETTQVVEERVKQCCQKRTVSVSVEQMSKPSQPRYHLVQRSLTWSEARSFCRVKYSDLATVRNMVDEHQLVRTLNGRVAYSWIGLRKGGSERWMWSDGRGVVHFSKWGDGEPNNSGNEWCGELSEKGSWNDLSCDEEKGFVCFDGHKNYRYYSDKKNWFDSRELCRSRHTDMAFINSDGDNSQVAEMVKSWTGLIWMPNKVWIGLFRDSWMWSDGSGTSFRYWQSRTQGHGSCAVASGSGRWVDSSCGNKAPFVCQGGLKVKKMVIRMKMQTDVDLSNSTVSDALLKKLEMLVQNHKVTDFKLSWRRDKNGVIFQPQNQPEVKEVARWCPFQEQ